MLKIVLLIDLVSFIRSSGGCGPVHGDSLTWLLRCWPHLKGCLRVAQTILDLFLSKVSKQGKAVEIRAAHEFCGVNAQQLARHEMRISLFPSLLVGLPQNCKYPARATRAPRQLLLPVACDSEHPITDRWAEAWRQAPTFWLNLGLQPVLQLPCRFQFSGICWHELCFTPGPNVTTR